MDSLRYFFLISSRDVSGSTCRTSKGFRFLYVAPGLSNRSICCMGVRTESRFSISFTCKHTKVSGNGKVVGLKYLSVK